MDKKNKILKGSYPSLVKTVRQELSDLEFFVKRRTGEGYWKIGRYIDNHLLENKDRANYGAMLVR